MLRNMICTSSHNYKKWLTHKVNTVGSSKLYRFTLPEQLFQQIEQLASDRQITVTELLRRFIKFGLVASYIYQKPGGTVILKENDTEYEIDLFPKEEAT